jgi:lipid-A-disaccharide synthase
MKYYIIAGEASGDLHGSNLIKALKNRDSNAEIWAWGGSLMQEQGVELRKHYRDLAFMGFVEVVKNLPTILKNMRFCKADILAFKPDAIIFIDYPGFNLRVAKWAHKLGFKTIYYISPQIWAWHTSRVHQIKQNIDLMFCILPFEPDFYKKYDYSAQYVGHPLLDVIPVALGKKSELSAEKPIIALLGGSRKQEIDTILPEMLAVVPFFPDYKFVVAAASAQPLHVYEGIINRVLGSESAVEVFQDRTYEILQNARAALVKSGTSTLETALFNVPQVVCYKGNALSFRIAKRLVKIQFISLVNLIVGKKIVEELIQDDLNTMRLREALNSALENTVSIQGEYRALREILGNEGASARTAQGIIDFLKG